MDDLTRTQPEDPKKINVNQHWELDYWCEELDVSEAILRRAVKDVGPMVADVKKLLGIE